MVTSKNRLEKLEDRLGPKKPVDNLPIILHKDGKAIPITSEELKKIKGDFIRVVEHDRSTTI